MSVPVLSPDRVTLPIGPVLDVGNSVQVGADGMNLAAKGGLLGTSQDGRGPAVQRQGIEAVSRRSPKRYRLRAGSERADEPAAPGSSPLHSPIPPADDGGMKKAPV